MATKGSRFRCKVCGIEYDGCASCHGLSWKVHTDTEEHYYILVTLMDYKYNKDADAAICALRKRGIDITKTDGYTPSVAALFAEINTATTPIIQDEVVVEELSSDDECDTMLWSGFGEVN